MRRDGSVQERDGKTSHDECDENNIIHLRNILTISKTLEQLTRQ
jgi:hypothetical protein